MPCALPASVRVETASGVYMAGLLKSPRQCSTALSNKTEKASNPAARFNRRAAVTAVELETGGEDGSGSPASSVSNCARMDCSPLRCASASIRSLPSNPVLGGVGALEFQTQPRPRQVRPDHPVPQRRRPIEQHALDADMVVEPFQMPQARRGAGRM